MVMSNTNVFAAHLRQLISMLICNCPMMCTLHALLYCHVVASEMSQDFFERAFVESVFNNQMTRVIFNGQMCPLVVTIELLYI
ncbi:unnamed protein product [Cuscuta epithymum]|uniref:Secreted protein n=1 Tax=Cuscuta epithymum TaxID=186058 RepID=A0AAV0C0J0_9ASTE|nr:unnamed protein product [Cuscuta epithymum]